MPNGLHFDISDDDQFKAFVVAKLTELNERTGVLDEIKPLVGKVPILEQEVKDIRAGIADDKFWNNVKLASAPFLIFLDHIARHLGLKL